MATTAITNNNVVYDNVVLANKFEDILATKVNMSNYMTAATKYTANVNESIAQQTKSPLYRDWETDRKSVV